MRIRSGAALDPGEVIDARGSGRGCLPVPLVFGGGGGLIGLLVLLLVLGVFGGGGNTQSSPAPGDLASRCTTGAAANQSTDCRVVAVVNSVQSYWSTALSEQGVTYTD